MEQVSITPEVGDLFPFALDPFQLQAAEAIAEGRNAVVTAPTGSGKTVVAEFAVHQALANGQRCFYTTPLKALSNQKFNDFVSLLGAQRVGLLTGDVSIRRDAEVVVMTTEVYRNMLYGTTHGDVGRNLARVRSIILDECHYMNDQDRGTVWEESIIYTPDSIQLVGLSATISNATELADWISSIHRDTELINTDFRPVPLRHYYFHKDQIHRLFSKGSRINPKLLRLRPPRRPGSRRRREKIKKVELRDVLHTLQRKDLLPAIFFVFSRRGCEQALKDTAGALKLSKDHRRELNGELERALRDAPTLARHPHLPFLRRGLAVHHAGQLPVWKSLVEHLFQKGLIGGVFATETLAAGINMPARTTVICAISKFSGDGHRLLTGSEFLQMSGRAGRRGMDEVGHVVVLSHPKEEVTSATALARAEPEPLESNFRPSYGMVLNLLERQGMEQVKQILERSFGQFLADSRLEERQDQLRAYDQKLVELHRPLCPGELGDQRRFRRLRDKFRAVKRQTRAIAAGGDDPEVKAELEVLGRRRETLKAELDASPCHKCPVFDPCASQRQQARQMERDRKQLSKRLRGAKTPYWQQFQCLVAVLQERGYLKGENPTEAGKMAAALRATNVLFLSEVAASGMLEELQPFQLAAVLTALVTESSRRLGRYDSPELSADTARVLHGCSRLALDLEKVQKRHRADIPIELNGYFSGLTEAWVQGCDWNDLEEMSGLEPGDIMRMFRRTLDVCRQFSHARGVTPRLREMCSLVEQGLARDEVQESLHYLRLPEELQSGDLEED